MDYASTFVVVGAVFLLLPAPMDYASIFVVVGAVFLSRPVYTQDCGKCSCCLNNDCDNSGQNGYCNQGCIDGYYPPTSCRYRCRYSTCKTCIDGNSCSSCFIGYYRNTCQNLCPTNCLNNVCEIWYGTCTNGCKQGFYGFKCNGQCSQNCINNVCTQDGSCTDGCKNGYYGSLCSNSCYQNCETCTSFYNCLACKPGYYGSYCQFVCGRGCTDGTCNKADGTCTCIDIFQGSTCDTCVDGWYGSSCDMQCKSECKTCNVYNYCSSCPDGYYGRNGCQQTCSIGCADICDVNGRCTCKSNLTGYYCNQCVSGMYGSSCNQPCPSFCPNCITNTYYDIGYSCSSCIDGYYSTPPTCKQCPQQCKTCVKSIHHPFDVYCNACEDGLHGNSCERCPTNCISCISETRCSACKAGFYGTTCQNMCSSNCENGYCYAHNGTCTSCVSGKYGQLCEEDCSVGCQDVLCTQWYGTCQCKDTYTGSKCDTCKQGRYPPNCNQCPTNCVTCSSGTSCETCKTNNYGLLCEKSCSGNCSSDGCQKDKGQCISCVDNRAGEFCESCTTGHYLTNNGGCTGCPNQCVDKACNVNNGYCSNGCTDGYRGNRCEQPCGNNCGKCDQETGVCLICEDNTFHGQSCNKPCSPNCVNSVCEKYTAKCIQGCKLNYYGDNCINECEQTCLTGIGGQRCHSENGTCLVGCRNGLYGTMCNQLCDKNCVLFSCSRDDGECSHGCTSGFQKNGASCIDASSNVDSRSSPSPAVIGGSVAGAVLIVGLGIACLVIIWKRRSGTGATRNTSTEHTYQNEIVEGERGITDDKDHGGYDTIKQYDTLTPTLTDETTAYTSLELVEPVSTVYQNQLL